MRGVEERLLDDVAAEVQTELSGAAVVVYAGAEALQAGNKSAGLKAQRNCTVKQQTNLGLDISNDYGRLTQSRHGGRTKVSSLSNFPRSHLIGGWAANQSLNGKRAHAIGQNPSSGGGAHPCRASCTAISARVVSRATGGSSSSSNNSGPFYLGKHVRFLHLSPLCVTLSRVFRGSSLQVRPRSAAVTERISRGDASRQLLLRDYDRLVGCVGGLGLPRCKLWHMLLEQRVVLAAAAPLRSTARARQRRQFALAGIFSRTCALRCVHGSFSAACWSI